MLVVLNAAAVVSVFVMHVSGSSSSSPMASKCCGCPREKECKRAAASAGKPSWWCPVTQEYVKHLPAMLAQDIASPYVCLHRSAASTPSIQSLCVAGEALLTLRFCLLTPLLALAAAGALFRAYPGPWQVLRRSPIDPEQTQCVWSSPERPSLKEVSLEILPNA